MNDTKQTPTRAKGRADIAWGSITRHSESGSVIEDRLAELVDTAPTASRFRIDIIHPDPDQAPSH
jgi:hypothetical protein